MIINVREKINQMSEQELVLLDNDLNKKPEILIEKLIGIYCGDNFSIEDIEQSIIEINLRMTNSINNWRLPRRGEIQSKTFDRVFWLEEDQISKEKKSLFLVMNL